jgi:hypothetical protein
VIAVAYTKSRLPSAPQAPSAAEQAECFHRKRGGVIESL